MQTLLPKVSHWCSTRSKTRKSNKPNGLSYVMYINLHEHESQINPYQVDFMLAVNWGHVVQLSVSRLYMMEQIRIIF